MVMLLLLAVALWVGLSVLVLCVCASAKLGDRQRVVAAGESDPIAVLDRETVDVRLGAALVRA